MTMKADYILDFRGTISSISLLKVTQVFHDMKSMETVEIMGCDEDTRNDLFKVLPKASYELLIAEEIGTEDHSYRVCLRKR